MKSIMAGLALSLLGGVAMAQTTPAQPPALKPPAAGPDSQPAAPGTQQPPAQPAPPAVGVQGMQLAPPQMGARNGQFEGEIVETPDGVYLVRPGQTGGERLHFGQGNQAPGPDGDDPMDATLDPGQAGGAGPAAAGPGPGGPAANGMPHHPPYPHRPPEGKGARFRIKGPNVTLGVKCPDDEPIKACVDAVSQLLDKVNQSAH